MSTISHGDLAIDNCRLQSAVKLGNMAIRIVAVVDHVKIVSDIQDVAETELGGIGGGDEVAEVNGADDMMEIRTLQSINHSSSQVTYG